MCPVTMTIISIALTVASTIIQMKMAAQRAAAQKKAAQMKHSLNTRNALARVTEERMKAQQEIEISRTRQAALEGQAKARGNLGERSVAALRREATRIGDRAVTTTKTNFEFARRQAIATIEGSHLQMGTTLMNIEKPDWVGAGLKIAAAAANSGMDAYNARQAAPPGSLASRF